MSLSKKILPNKKMMTMTVLTIAIGSFLLTGSMFVTPSHSAFAVMPNQNMIGNTGGFGHWGFGHGMNNGFGNNQGW